MRHFGLLLLMVLLSPAFVRAQELTKLNSEEAAKLIEKRNLEQSELIDGRTAEMFAEGHIRGAIHIDAFHESALQQLKACLKKEQLIVYCQTHKRSDSLVSLLQQLQYRGHIFQLSNGISDWIKNGFETVATATDEAATSSVPETSKGKWKPIMQLFGTAAYDLNTKAYNYHFGRAHLGFSYQMNEKWSAKMIIDRGPATHIDNIQLTNSEGNEVPFNSISKEGSVYTMFLKFASLHWQPNPRLSIEGGAVLQNHYIVQERFWGFRYVAQTFQDMYWQIPSSDLGFVLNYKITNHLSIHTALTNGEGPRVAQDASGKVKYAGGFDFEIPDKLQLHLYYHQRESETAEMDNEQMYSAFAGYRFSNKFRLGAEYNYMDNLGRTAGLDSYGYSVFSAYQFPDHLQLFIRYDHLKYSPNSLTNADSDAFIGGLAYNPVPDVNLALNYQSRFHCSPHNSQGLFLSMEYHLK